MSQNAALCRNGLMYLKKIDLGKTEGNAQEHCEKKEKNAGNTSTLSFSHNVFVRLKKKSIEKDKNFRSLPYIVDFLLPNDTEF